VDGIYAYSGFETYSRPEFSNSSPSNNAYNVSLTTSYNVTITEDEGNTSTVNFYISTDNSSWTHLQTNTTVLNESVSVDLTDLDHDTLYYIKTTANDTQGNNESYITSFETTPYTSDYFNTTFHTENWVQSTNNMSFETSFYNTSFLPSLDDVVANNWCNPDPDDGFMGITNVKLNNLDRTTSDSDTFENETEYGTVLTSGNSYTMDVAICSVSSTYTQYVNVYIDYNIDGDFTDAGEWIGGATGVGTVEVSFTTNTIQETSDSTAMMVHSQYNSNFSNPCSTNFGDIEMYSVTSEVISGGSANIISENITKQGDNWDKFYVDVNNTATFSLIDPVTDYTILSDLNGDGDDISSVTNSTVRIRGDFNASLSVDSINITWSTIEPNYELIPDNMTLYGFRDHLAGNLTSAGADPFYDMRNGNFLGEYIDIVTNTSEEINQLFLYFDDEGDDLDIERLKFKIINSGNEIGETDIFDSILFNGCEYYNVSDLSRVVGIHNWGDWAGGSDPFPLSGESFLRLKIYYDVPDNADVGTFSADNFYVQWYGEDMFDHISTESLDIDVVIYDEYEADFTYEIENNTVTFNATDPIWNDDWDDYWTWDSWTWDFGDGNYISGRYSEHENPTHLYNFNWSAYDNLSFDVTLTTGVDDFEHEGSITKTITLEAPETDEREEVMIQIPTTAVLAFVSILILITILSLFFDQIKNILRRK